MLSFLKKLFGSGPDIAALLEEGATIVDVRTPGEYNSGHIKGSMNIPLDSLASKTEKLKSKGTLILCCASGMRSGAGVRILKGKGFEQVYNGGSWMSVKNKMK